jgi:hypothetical protein
MPKTAKFLIGLAATLLLGWLWHGPLGNGARFIDSVERQANADVAATGLAGIEVRLGRDPLSRTATLSGPANDFQRRGMGSQPGLTRIVAATNGVGAVRWADEGKAGGSIPLLAEMLGLLLIAYLVGLGAARLLFGRAKRTSYLD